MLYTYPYIRGISLMTLVALATQIVTPIIENTYANNTTYYVDASFGNDGSDGLTESGAWQTIARVNSGGFLPGDQILFKCGEGWNEQLLIQDSGAIGSPITFGSYGASCDGSNRPAITYVGGPQIAESGTVSYTTVQDFDLSAGDSTGAVIEFSSNGANISITNTLISNPSGKCIGFTQSNNITISGNEFTNCAQGIELGNGIATVSGNNFHTMGSIGAAITMSFLSTGTRTISDNIFSSLGNSAVKFGQDSIVEHNTINNSCVDSNDCAAITNITQDISNFELSLSGTVRENFITTVGTGVNFDTYHQDGIRLDNLSRGVQVTGNTISGAQRAIAIKNGRFHTLSSNTIYNPRTYAIHVIEDETSGSGEVVESNTLSNNTILTYNPDYSMVRIEDTVNNLGTLANLSGNKFLNVYKSKLPIVEVIKTGGNSIQADKDQLSLIDGAASNFTYFGYKVYTSTGVYSGSNLITNGAFGANITGWSTDVLTLFHNAGSGTLRATQGIASTGTLSSNVFSIVTNRVYEVSGWVQNITNSEGHVIKIRVRNGVGGSYIDRDLDVVATSTGTTFKAYVKANSTASDAQLDFVVSNPSTAVEFDNIVVREVAGLTYNSRNNEAVLVSNTGSSATSKSCPGLPFCTQYSDYSNNPISWPIMIGGYSSQIVFWNEATQILRRPTGTFVPSSGTAPNGTSVTLTWSTSNSLSQRLSGNTYTGAFDYVVPTSGTMTVIPPPDGTNTYTFAATNDVGTMSYTADVVTQNTPPTNDPAFATGSEDTLSITGVVTASDVNSGGVLSYQSFDAPLHGVLIDFQSDGTYDYRPNSDFCGTDTFTFLASDAWGLKDGMNPGVVTITVLCVNDTPVAIDDNLSGTGGVTGWLDVLLNDTDPDTPYESQTFSITGLTQPTNGVVSISGSSIEYTPNLAFYGPDSFTYMVEDQSGALSNVATVSLTVAPGMNLPPEVSGMSINTNEDSAVADFLSGSDINSDALTFSASILPIHGILTIVGSGFTYTPNANYYGTDSFVFFANDGTVDSSGATINITINPVEDLPLVVSDTVNVEIQTPTLIDIMANDLDPDNLTPTPPNQGLTITGYTLPTNGTLSVVGNQFQYTGNLGYLGPDTFDYSVIDANGNISNTGTVNITVSTTNQFPIADSGSFVTNEDTTLIQTLSGSDPDLTPVTFVLNSDVTHGILTLSSTGEFVYTPDANYYGADSFTFHVTDGVLSSGVQTVTLEVTSVNDMPTANNDTATGTEDIATLFDPLINDNDVDTGDILSLHTIVTQPIHGSATQSGNQIEYTPSVNYCGPDSLMYQVIDLSGSVSNVAGMTINVICTNDGPTVSDSSYSIMGNIPTNSGNILTASLTGVDIDGDVLTYLLDTDVTNGVLSVSSTGYMTYTPNLGFSGTDSFTYSVDDGNIAAGSATVTITVNPNNVNLSPVANDATYVIDEDNTLINAVTGTDPESDPLTYILDTNVTHGSLSFQSSGSFTYTPMSNYYGTDTFTFYVYDGLNNSATGTVIITINAINDTPVVNNDTANGTEDGMINFSPLTNDTDIDVGDILTLAGYTNGTHGTVTNSGSTNLLYTPNANYCGTDSITYTVQDQSGALSNTGSITLNISCVNDNPTAADDILADNGLEDSSITIPVLMNDTDIEDGTPPAIANLTQPSSGGTVGIVGSDVVFSPTANYCGTTPITFTYQARDSAGTLSNVANVTIPAIDCINDIPTVQGATYTMTGNIVISSGTIDGSGNLVGYSETDTILYATIAGADVEGSILSFTLATLPSSGTATVISTGSFIYKPAPNFVGSIAFTVLANDGSANSAPATINICIISPDEKVTRPSCAPPVYVPLPTPNVGPGGGGGGGSSAIGTISNNYTTVISNGINDTLASQLYLSQRELSPKTSSGNTNTAQTPSSISTGLDETIQNLLGTISTVVETAKITSLSTTDGSKVIRSAGRTILSRIISSTFSSEEQLERVDSSMEQINSMGTTASTLRETLTLKYILRIFYAKRAKLLMEIEFFNNMMN